MGKINICLQYLFIVFNLLFAIIGCLMILSNIIASFSSGQLSLVGSPPLILRWVCPFSVFGISCLGVSAASSEKETPLKIFAGFMAVGMIITLSFGFVSAVKRDQIKSDFDFGSREYTNFYSEVLLITMAFYFGLSVIALLGLLISLFMIHQIRRPDGTGESSIAMKVY